MHSRVPGSGALLFICITCSLLLAPAGLAAGLAGETLQRIKLVLDGQTYVWETDQPRPTRAEGSFQDPGFVFDLAGFVPGETAPREALLARVVRARALLKEARLYNESQIFLVDSRSKPGFCTLLIQARAGFSLRFGGGPAYALAGDDNADGALLAWRAWGGWNRAGAWIGQGLPDLSGLWWRGGMDYRNNALVRLEGEDWRHDFTLTAQGGWNSRPFFAGLGLEAGSGFSSDPAQDWTFKASPRIGFLQVWDLGLLVPRDAASGEGESEAGEPSGAITLGADLHAWAASTLPEEALVGSLGSRIVFKARTGCLTLASQASLDLAAPGLPDRLATDYAGTDDASVRGDYDQDWLVLDHALLWNTEVRLEVFRTNLGLISDFRLEGFLFYDTLAGGRRSNDESPWFDRQASAFGPGLRIGFGSPVNADFTLTLGMNPEIFNSPDPANLPLRLGFCASAGF